MILLNYSFKKWYNKKNRQSGTETVITKKVKNRYVNILIVLDLIRDIY